MRGQWAAAAFAVAATCGAAAQADEPRPPEASRDAIIFETSARQRIVGTETAFRGDRPKAWDTIVGSEARASLRVLAGLFESKLEIGASADRFAALSNLDTDQLRGELQLGINTGAWSYLVEWKTRGVFVPGYDDFITGLNTYDARIRYRFTADIFEGLPLGLFQASIAGGYVAATPHIFARTLAECEVEMVQRLGGGFAIVVAPKIEISDFVDFPGGDRDDLILSLKITPSYNFGGGLTLSLDSQAIVALSTREAKTGETWEVTPVLRWQKAL